ncbi:MAG: AAA family ATPase [Thaumarchaeota archaeon]|nr:AAA family ATPase [Nitrososphaerota archaeon]
MTQTLNPSQKTGNSEEAMTKQTRLVLCITGMPGSGKSTASEISKSMGFEVFRMGDDVRMEAERRKLAPTDENLGAIMLQLRQSGGPIAIAHLCKQRIEKDSKSPYVLIDGIRNMNEFLEFQKLGEAVLISIHASPERRYKFLQSRARSDSPNSFQSFEARDRRELSVGIGEAIALSDEIIINSGSIEELKRNVSELFSRLKKSFASSDQTETVS